MTNLTKQLRDLELQFAEQEDALAWVRESLANMNPRLELPVPVGFTEELEQLTTVRPADQRTEPSRPVFFGLRG